ncbi:ABC transporter permease [Frankia sp. AgB32]|uniref:ABC transporter permease n=1 Tax=Frankia sp. AgB32 TaxID=631119 RepID=UPI00200DB5C5|nr:ABC transporter permease [Frankia sp. AgB32]MCK9893825.1 ABC transporter permease [Frankia sp. AgB32]
MTGQLGTDLEPGTSRVPEPAQDAHQQLAHRSRAQTRVRWELLRNLVRKDLKVKYKGSTLGFAWSLANPLLLLVVYTFVFQIVLKSGIPRFGIYLMSGLLIWNAFSGSVSAACGAVVANANLVKKVRFPLAVLPLSAVGFAAVHFMLQLVVLFAVILIIGYPLIGPDLLLVLPAGAVALTFTVALSLLVSALNVRYRDTAHLLDVALLAWFWLNPMVYAFGLIQAKLHEWTWVYLLNPMAVVVITFQRAIYHLPAGYHPPPGSSASSASVLAHDEYSFYLEHLAVAGAISLALLWIGLYVFRTMQADFAEDL